MNGPTDLETVVFDLDGTLVDTAPEIQFSLNEALREMNFPPMHLMQVKEQVGKGGLAMVEAALAHAGQQTTPERIRMMQRLYEMNCRVNLGTRSLVYPGVFDLLMRLRSDGIRLAICTNKLSNFAEPLLEHMRLRPYFSAVVCGDTLKIMKPSSEPLLKAIDEIGGQPTRSLMVGDTDIDLKCAEDSGVASAWVRFGYQDKRRLSRQPDIVVGAYSEFYQTLADRGYRVVGLGCVAPIVVRVER